MSVHDFIFSNKIPFRVGRHFAFWVTVFLVNSIGSSCVFIMNAPSSLTLSLSVLDIASDLDMKNLSLHVKATLSGLVILIPYCYLIAYWFVPRLLVQEKYARFIIWFIVLTAIGYVLTLYLWGFFEPMPKHERLVMLWFSVIAFVNNSPPITCGMFMAVILLKNWLAKEEEKLLLVKENAKAELQLLKAQVHPHFLFNTLNNIYSFSLDRSAKAPELVVQLSEVLRYMVNDCEASMVPVEREIKMIEDYVGLEKVRYGDRLDLQVRVVRSADNQLIVPFLLIPFVENSFKHGTSEVLKNPWIKLNIEVNAGHFYFELINSRPLSIGKSNGKKGIGLINVEKRLQLLYPATHQLSIDTTQPDRFAVTLRVPLLDALYAPQTNHLERKSNQALPELLYD